MEVISKAISNFINDMCYLDNDHVLGVFFYGSCVTGYTEKTWGNALYATFDQKVEEHLIQPTFITMYPVEVSP